MSTPDVSALYDNLPDNSHQGREDKKQMPDGKRAEKVVRGTVKAKKNDIRKLGSGNPGTLNMSRNLGLKAGLLTFFLDIMKGSVPTLIAFFVFKDKCFKNSTFIIADFAIFLCGFCAVLGHIYPVFLKFKGGKGIATTIGVFIVCQSVFGW